MDAKTLLETTIERLRRHEGSYAEITRQTGVSYSSLVKLAQGHAENPTVANLQRVIEALDRFERTLGPAAAVETQQAATP